jgi:hypothetical protein
MDHLTRMLIKAWIILLKGGHVQFVIGGMQDLLDDLELNDEVEDDCAMKHSDLGTDEECPICGTVYYR